VIDSILLNVIMFNFILLDCLLPNVNLFNCILPDSILHNVSLFNVVGPFFCTGASNLLHSVTRLVREQVSHFRRRPKDHLGSDRLARRFLVRRRVKPGLENNSIKLFGQIYIHVGVTSAKS
jgi:hypothetical protein